MQLNHASSTPTPMLDVALSYLAHKWPVFPCRSANEVSDDYDPETGEFTEYKAKTPLLSNGFKGATLSERLVRSMWEQYPLAAIGIPTGEKTGVFVLDVDLKEGANGYEWLDAMESLHGDLPTTATASTPSGGRHYYFNYVVGTRNRGALGLGCDIRSEGGFVLSPGSVMASGKSYEWIDHAGEGIPAIADAPDWLLELVIKKTPVADNNNAGSHNYTAGTYTSPSTPTNSGKFNPAYVENAVNSELSELARVPMGGGRNIELNKSAFCLGTFVGAGALSESEARELLRDVARGWGRDISLSFRTIENGLSSGMKSPRAIPESNYESGSRYEPGSRYEDGTHNTSLDAMTAIVERGIAKAKARELQESIADSEADESASEESVDLSTPIDSTPPPSAHTAAEEKGILDTSPIIATPFSWVDPKTLPQREFAYGKHYIRKYVSVTSSPGGLGKTSLSVAETLSMASGKAILGDKPKTRLKVWLFNAEDPRDELERRIMAACLHYKLKPEDIEGHIFLDTGREQELVIAVDNKKGVVIQEPVVEAVVREIKRHKIDVMIIDPFVSTHNVNENDNGAIDKVAKMWAKIADHTNIAIDVVHHLRKVSDREATVEDSRGAVSLLAAARSARVLNRMTVEQADESGVHQKDRLSYFSISYGKSSMSKSEDTLTWRKLESQGLGNGSFTPKKPFGTVEDSVGVVTEWRWPSLEEMAQEVTPEQLNHIKTMVDNSNYKERYNAKPWVGEAVAYALDMDIDEKHARKKVTKLIKAWFESGDLVTVEEKDPVTRKHTTFVRAG